MSLRTCIACAARRAVGALTCPHCGASEHEEGDTVSGAEGGQGQRHIPEAYATPAPTAPPAPAAVDDAAPEPAPEADATP